MALPQRATSGPDPERLAADREALAHVKSCIEALDVKKRTVLVLHELEGMDTKVIADV